jgi:hypothetical protein
MTDLRKPSKVGPRIGGSATEWRAYLAAGLAAVYTAVWLAIWPHASTPAPAPAPVRDRAAPATIARTPSQQLRATPRPSRTVRIRTRSS